MVCKCLQDLAEPLQMYECEISEITIVEKISANMASYGFMNSRNINSENRKAYRNYELWTVKL